MQTEYKDRVEMEVVAIKSVPGWKDFASEHFPNSNHGLIARNSKGEIIEVIEGHDFKKSDIVGVINTLLN
ncbi:MAG: hypothetical protein KDB53_06315 [Planctomycetes bacterium]|nr:hypothetical protein [Planctomycetota bacterium]